MDYEKLLLMLAQLKEGFEYCGWTAGREFQKYMISIIEIFQEIFEHGTIAPRIPAFVKESTDEYIQRMGYAPLTDDEWNIFSQMIYRWADWEQAMIRCFWEEILTRRVGPEARINQRYDHIFQHCDVEWMVTGYMDYSHKCPECGKLVSPIKSVPIWED